MARIITGLAATTELEALNEMLSVIGESPVSQSEIENPSMSDVEIAVNILRNTTREILSLGWLFNSEIGYELAPEATTYTWTGTDADTATLNVFKVPATLISFSPTSSSGQSGSLFVDTEARIATADPGAAQLASVTAGDLIFYDRSRNREGWDSTDHPYLYLDPIWLIDFEDSPESFRRYVAIKSARRFQARMVGSQELDGFTDRDERIAMRTLRREQALRDQWNIFDNVGTLRHVGLAYRRRGAVGMLENRDSAGRT